MAGQWRPSELQSNGVAAPRAAPGPPPATRQAKPSQSRKCSIHERNALIRGLSARAKKGRRKPPKLSASANAGTGRDPLKGNRTLLHVRQEINPDCAPTIGRRRGREVSGPIDHAGNRSHMDVFHPTHAKGLKTRDARTNSLVLVGGWARAGAIPMPHAGTAMHVRKRSPSPRPPSLRRSRTCPPPAAASNGVGGSNFCVESRIVLTSGEDGRWE